MRTERRSHNLHKEIMKRNAFTLVEIMIVVLIIGILLAIAVPNFMQARTSSRTKSCVANLRQIDAAKQQAAMDLKLQNTDTPLQNQLTPVYIKVWPVEPQGGTYTIGDMSTNPSCSFGGTHIL
jgi:prepilin-type N-terminal cleavage/methylation domain-containing protein